MCHFFGLQGLIEQQRINDFKPQKRIDNDSFLIRQQHFFCRRIQSQQTIVIQNNALNKGNFYTQSGRLNNPFGFAELNNYRLLRLRHNEQRIQKNNHNSRGNNAQDHF